MKRVELKIEDGELIGDVNIESALGVICDKMQEKLLNNGDSIFVEIRYFS